MQAQAKRFKTPEIDIGHRLHFPFGLLGFPDIKDYVLQDIASDIPFKHLQAIDEPDLAFVLLDPFILVPDYHVLIEDQDLLALNVRTTESLQIFVILTIPPAAPQQATANLQGPVIVNTANRRAKQIVLTQSPYHTRHLLLTPMVRETAANSKPESRMRRKRP